MGKIFIFLFIVLPNSIYAQVNIDSLIQALDTSEDSLKIRTYINLWKATEFTDKSVSMQYARECLNYSKKVGYKSGIADCYHLLANTKANSYDFDSAIYYFNKSISHFKDLGYKKKLVPIYDNFANVYQKQGKNELALNYLDTAFKIAEVVGDSFTIASVQLGKGMIEDSKGNFRLALQNYSKAYQYYVRTGDELRQADLSLNMGSAYAARGNHKKAIEIMSEAESVYRKRQDNYFLAVLYNNTANYYYYLGELDSTKKYLDLALPLAIKSRNNSIRVTIATIRGKYYHDKQQFDSAIYFHRKAIDFSLHYDYLLQMAMGYYFLAEIYYEQKNYSKSLQMLDSAEYYGVKQEATDDLADIYEMYSKVYLALGNEHMSYDYFRKFTEFKDSVFNIEKTRQIAEMEAIYENEKKTRELEIKNKDIQLLSKNLKIESARRKLFFTAGISAFILLVFAVVGYNLKIRKDRKIRIIEKQKGEEQRRNLLLEKQLLNKELEVKKREITSHTINLIKKNEFLESIGDEIKNYTVSGNISDIKNKVNRLIRNNKQFDQEWEKFRIHFEEVHQDFFEKVKDQFPEITPMEIKLASFMKLNLSAKEIASIMNVTPETLKKARYRLKKKMVRNDNREISEIILEL